MKNEELEIGMNYELEKSNDLKERISEEIEEIQSILTDYGVYKTNPSYCNDITFAKYQIVMAENAAAAALMESTESSASYTQQSATSSSSSSDRADFLFRKTRKGNNNIKSVPAKVAQSAIISTPSLSSLPQLLERIRLRASNNIGEGEEYNEEEEEEEY